MAKGKVRVTFLQTLRTAAKFASLTTQLPAAQEIVAEFTSAAEKDVAWSTACSNARLAVPEGKGHRGLNPSAMRGLLFTGRYQPRWTPPSLLIRHAQIHHAQLNSSPLEFCTFLQEPLGNVMWGTGGRNSHNPRDFPSR